MRILACSLRSTGLFRGKLREQARIYWLTENCSGEASAIIKPTTLPVPARAHIAWRRTISTTNDSKVLKEIRSRRALFYGILARGMFHVWKVDTEIACYQCREAMSGKSTNLSLWVLTALYMTSKIACL